MTSPQHDPEITHAEPTEAVIEEIIKPVLPKEMISDHIKYLINPTGRFVVGGPMGDCGLTGRKIIVDTYGGAAHHGGGAFSGKDPSKVDRSATYAGRYVAKNIVAAVCPWVNVVMFSKQKIMSIIFVTEFREDYNLQSSV